MNNVIQMKPHLLEPLNYIKNGIACTPDFRDLKHCGDDMFPVFIFDEVKKDHMYHDWIKDSVYFGRATTNSYHYMMKINPATKCPLVFKTDCYRLGGKQVNMQSTGKITGELYAMPLRALADLDLYMQNTMAVNRKEDWFAMRDQDGKSTLAWIYVADYEYFDNGNNEVLHMTDATYLPARAHFAKEFYFWDPDDVTLGPPIGDAEEKVPFMGIEGLDNNWHM
jgi:hypothetical protein